MDLSSSFGIAAPWWLLVGALVAAELATGTFYLLMVALGCMAGALAAHAGVAVTAQIAVAALIGIATTTAWHLKRARQPAAAPAQSNRDVILDIGQRVRIDSWQADGLTRVQYRGASWAARYVGTGAPVAGEHVIVAMDGNELRVALPAPH